MYTRRSDTWDSLLAGLWFVPTLMTLGGFALSIATINIDRSLPYDWAKWVDWLWAGGAAGAHQVLSVIAGSMVTVGGVVFSVTIVALTLASQQFGPYLLRHFTQDRGNQVTLGTFIATFVYCLMILRHIREGAFLGDLSVFCGILLALASVGVLIYFIHHVAVLIHAESLIAAVGGELSRVIEERYPPEAAQSPETETPPEPELPENPKDEARRIAARGSGYIRAIFYDELMRLAEAGDLLIRLERRPGDFVVREETLAQVWPAERCHQRLAAGIGAAIMVGPRRKARQDAKYDIDRLVQISLRALSPGINDTLTALICVDWLGAGLSRLAERGLPLRHFYDGRKRLRLIAQQPAFPEMADAAFNEIRQYATLPVIFRLLETIPRIAEHVHRPEDRAALRRHAELVHETGQRRQLSGRDLEKLETRYRRALETLAPA
jgi:uncharacterized membrane protein